MPLPLKNATITRLNPTRTCTIDIVTARLHTTQDSNFKNSYVTSAQTTKPSEMVISTSVSVRSVCNLHGNVCACFLLFCFTFTTTSPAMSGPVSEQTHACASPRIMQAYLCIKPLDSDHLDRGSLSPKHSHCASPCSDVHVSPSPRPPLLLTNHTALLSKVFEKFFSICGPSLFLLLAHGLTGPHPLDVITFGCV